FAVERLGAQATLPMRVLDDADRLGEDARAELVLQEAGAARDRRAGDRPQQVRDEATRDARVEDHRNLAGRHLARAEPLDRPLAGLPADLLGLAQIARIDRAGEIVVAFHRR